MIPSSSLPGNPDVDTWLSFTADGEVIVRSGKVDIGQRVSAAVGLVAAEELDVAPQRIRVAVRETGTVPDEGSTAGSRSMADSAQAIRLASATARRHLLQLASVRLASEPGELEVNDGLVRVIGTNRTVSYWQLAGDQPLGIPVDPEVRVKSPSRFRLLGQPFEAPGLVDLTTGAARFVHDMVLPDMLHARVVRPPNAHSRLEELETGIASRLDGGHLVRDGSFLAVAHPSEWTATRLAGSVEAACQWSFDNRLDTRDLGEQLLTNPAVSLPVIDGEAVDQAVPELAPPPNDSVATLSVRFQRPYQMHAAIGPSAAMARLVDGRLTVWTHSQAIYTLRDCIADALERERGSVHLIHVPGAGCYGHNGADDAAFDAALVACAIPGRPVLLKWSRADEHGWEPYGPAMDSTLQASLGADGKVLAWSHETWSGTHRERAHPGSIATGAARLLASAHRAKALTPAKPSPALGKMTALHRNQDPIYRFPNQRIVKHLVPDLPLRSSALRGLGAFFNIFAIEAFMDELAAAAGTDHVEFRLRHLHDERARRVVELAARMLGPRQNDGSPSGLGRGLGFSRYKNMAGFAAVGIELSVGDDASVRLVRAVIAADAGEIIDRQGIQSQLEGGLLQSASMTLYEEVAYDAGGVTSRDWESYPILRFDNVPVIETEIIARPGESFLGVGEVTMGPTAAAIANAIHDAIGLRLRRMPFTADAIRTAALV
jgi:nicotinate dehydrogenase subunit B